MCGLVIAGVSQKDLTPGCKGLSGGTTKAWLALGGNEKNALACHSRTSQNPSKYLSTVSSYD